MVVQVNPLMTPQMRTERVYYCIVAAQKVDAVRRALLLEEAEAYVLSLIPKWEVASGAGPHTPYHLVKRLSTGTGRPERVEYYHKSNGKSRRFRTMENAQKYADALNADELKFIVDRMSH